MRFKKRKHPLFSVQTEEQLEHLSGNEEDAFFEEAFSNHATSAEQPMRSFVGAIIPKQRFTLIAGITCIVLLGFIGRASALQIVQGEEYRAQAEQNRTRYNVTPSPRGVIYDRNGVVLASNTPHFSLVGNLTQLEALEEEQDKHIERIAQFFQTPTEELAAIIEEADRSPQLLLIDDITYNDAIRFTATNELDAVWIESSSRRQYITDTIPSLSHVLGYTGNINESEFDQLKAFGYRQFDHVGKQGIEKMYESTLRGKFGEEVVEVDAAGNTERVISKLDPVDGKNIYLTIDSELQKHIEDVLVARMEGTPATGASVIAMNPKNGEILALVSWPSYDANLFSQGIDQESYQALLNDEKLPLFPRATSGEFPSGSTIKPVFAAGALERGIITKTTRFLSTGGLRISLWFFPDWRAGGHGSTDIYHAIADSVNTFFYLIGGGDESFVGLGLEGLMEVAAQYKFGSKTGIDLPVEADGFLPSKEWKVQAKKEAWYIGDTYHVAIGQGDFLATPLQIAQSTAIFANNGILHTPHLNQNTEVKTERITSEDIATTLKQAMRQTITAGSATSLQATPVPVAGKTGTAQWATNKPNHSWFTGFGPYENPDFVLTVLVQEGADTSLAIPVSRDIFNWWFEKNPPEIAE